MKPVVGACIGWLLMALSGCSSGPTDRPDNAGALSAIRSGGGGREVVVEGTVTRVESPRRGPSGVHERFLIALSENSAGKDARPAPDAVSVLIADNVSIAEPAPVRVGDDVVVKGVLALDPAGPVIHWTHRDPRFHHVAGYVELRGRVYD
ncbi:MAG: DUF3465 domain-containing protein [Candidatus Eremiobacteraeota bacterium]|nr:DUF3465 domain-containing protein [Candidatus Eremiobacteraeota bacterium]